MVRKRIMHALSALAVGLAITAFSLVAPVAWAHADAAVSDAGGLSSALIAGGKVTVGEDVVVSGTLDAVGGATLDLAGHRVTVLAAKDAGGKIDGSGGAVVFSGGGTFAVTDSVGGGALVLEVGSDHESNTTSQYGYTGIAVTGGGTLAISKASVEVCYMGATSVRQPPSFALRGVWVKSGAVTLDAGARLSVLACRDDGAFGATTVAGIHLCADGAQGRTSIARDSSVTATSNAAPIVRGANANAGAQTGTNSENNAELIELELTPDEPLYQEIAREFLTHASYDAKNDLSGSVYNVNVYYASSLSLPSGLTVWAYSDRVSQEEEGTHAAITPDHVFIRSNYTMPAIVYGIEAEEGFLGTVAQAGEVRARVGSGQAAAVMRSESGSWQLADDMLFAECGDASYKLLAGPLDLRDFIDFGDAATSRIVYPQRSSYSIVREVEPVAVGVATVGERLWEPVDGSAAREALAGYEEQYAGGAEGDQVSSLVFYYFRPTAAGGYLYSSDSTNGLASPYKAIDVANTRQKAGDVVTVDGTPYVFRGWSTRSSDKEPLYVDEIPAARSGDSFRDTATYYGIYAVAPSEATVRFHVDGAVYATASAVPASLTINAAFAASNNPVEPTSKVEGATFSGWSLREKSDSYMYGNIRTVGEVARGASEVDLYAVWSGLPGEEGDKGEGKDDSLVTVRFIDADDSVIDVLTFAKGQTVYAGTAEDPRPAGANADLFQGWVDIDGRAFSTKDTVVSASQEVFATYLQTGSGSGAGLAGSGGGSAAVVTPPRGAVLSGAGGAVAVVRDYSDPEMPIGGDGGGDGSAPGSAAAAGAGSAAQADAFANNGAIAAALRAQAEGTEADGGVEPGGQGGGGAFSGGSTSKDAGAAETGFALFVIAILGALVASVKWFFTRHAGEDEGDEAQVQAASEPESIRF